MRIQTPAPGLTRSGHLIITNIKNMSKMNQQKADNIGCGLLIFIVGCTSLVYALSNNPYLEFGLEAIVAGLIMAAISYFEW